jgi:PAS domain S-box-containing protein
MECWKSVPPPAVNAGGSPLSDAEVDQRAQRELIFVAFFETATYPMMAESLDGTITAWNPAAQRLYGYPAAIAIGSKIEMIIPTDRINEHRALLRKALNEDPIEDFDTVRVARDGRRIDVSLSVRPVKSSSGDIVGIANITRDLTAKRFAEEKFRLAVEACTSGMVMVAATGRIVMANGEIERMFGYRLDELIGQQIDILVSESLRPQHIRHREGFARKPEARRMGMGRDLFGRRKNGSEFPVEVVLNPIETPDGFLVLGIVVDISERKRVEHLKDEFVSTVSHELRTPLTSISASLALLAHTADARP